MLAGVGVLLTSLLWFLTLTAWAGPPVSLPAGDHSSPSYYERIAGATGVGPSLRDPWVVREIDLAAADLWGQGSGGGSDTVGVVGGGVGGAGDGAGAARLLGGGNVVGVATAEAGANRVQQREVAVAGGMAWDGVVNEVMMGPLVDGNRTLPSADLLLTIFSGNTGVSSECWSAFSCRCTDRDRHVVWWCGTVRHGYGMVSSWHH